MKLRLTFLKYLQVGALTALITFTLKSKILN